MMQPISVWGLLGGHDGQRPMGTFGLDAGVTPLLFFEGHPGIFNDHRESGPRFNVSSERWCFFAVLCLGVDRYVFFRADADTDYYRSSRPITNILNRYTCLV